MVEVVRPEYIGKYLCESNRKKNVMVTVRRDLLAIAREYGLNLSKLLETSLIQLLDSQNNAFSLSKVLFPRKEKVWWAGPDLNRRASARQANVLPNFLV